jgi:uncharacterized protein
MRLGDEAAPPRREAPGGERRPPSRPRADERREEGRDRRPARRPDGDRRPAGGGALAEAFARARGK